MNLLVTNARAITLDPDRPTAGSVLVLNERIVAAGEGSEVAALAPEGTPTIDARQRVLIPGFVETHTHPLSSGLSRLTTVNCGTPPNRTVDEVLDRLAAAVAETEGTTPVRGTVYDDSLIEDNRHLTRDDLDRVSALTPVVVPTSAATSPTRTRPRSRPPASRSGPPIRRAVTWRVTTRAG